VEFPRRHKVGVKYAQLHELIAQGGRVMEIWAALLLALGDRRRRHPYSNCVLTNRTILARKTGLQRLASITAALRVLHEGHWIARSYIRDQNKLIRWIRIRVLHPTFRVPKGLRDLPPAFRPPGSVPARVPSRKWRQVVGPAVPVKVEVSRPAEAQSSAEGLPARQPEANCLQYTPLDDDLALQLGKAAVADYGSANLKRAVRYRLLGSTGMVFLRLGFASREETEAASLDLYGPVGAALRERYPSMPVLEAELVEEKV